MNFDLDTSNYSKEDYYEIFNLDKFLSLFSKIITLAFGSCSFAVIAAIKPAAPPPITAILFIFGKAIKTIRERFNGD